MMINKMSYDRCQKSYPLCHNVLQETVFSLKKELYRFMGNDPILGGKYWGRGGKLSKDLPVLFILS